ncbi:MULTISPECIES: SH3 domain-containing protein [unclassified Streptococcus]|uniref:SH3 domain-containing protein n=1 Tax=unclassified Streptococcus TaxID=2608887 RepID=UPI001072A1D2|nr:MULTISPECIES: SH3 domain-containing protein [unclassified Streptococcus]MBF0805414.1 SH3 domain-containing protein [Streptococcus sp. 19428wA2_WM07]TFU29128.1 YSIRK-type signal peptide-containing protein [Streptococcus sp. WM07]
MKAKDLWNPVQRYSIRKYSVGVASIAIGTVLLGAASTVGADQVSMEVPLTISQQDVVENQGQASLDGVYAAPAQSQPRVVQLSADQLQEFPEQPAQELATSGLYTFAETVGVKDELSVKVDVAFYFQAGDQVHYDQLHHQEGYQWLSYKSYSGQRRYAPIGVLNASPLAPQVEEKQEIEASAPLAASGTYKFDGRYGIKKEARLASPDVAYYDKGGSVNYDKVLEADGHRWLSYLSYGGTRHYIAVEKLAAAPKVESKPVAKPEVKPQVQSLASAGTYKFDGRYGIKKEARLVSPDVAYYDKGGSVNYDKVLEADGHRWLSYLSYSGIRHYIAVEKLAAAPKVESKPAAKPEVKPQVQSLASAGTYKFDGRYGIKKEARLASPDVAYYDKGGSVNYDKVLEADGHRWLSYLSYSGTRHYIAVEKLATAPKGEARPETKPEVPSTSSAGIPSSGTFRFEGRFGIKKEARVTSPDVAYYDKGGSVNYDKVLEADGHRWLSYLSYGGTRHYIAIEKLAAASKTEVKPSLHQGLPSAGTYTFGAEAFVKNKAQISAAAVALYEKGMSVNYDKIVQAEGRNWLSYISGSGVRRYILLPL